MDNLHEYINLATTKMCDTEKQSSFFTLPPELRVQVYTLVYNTNDFPPNKVSKAGERIDDVFTFRVVDIPAKSQHNRVIFLATCKAIHFEAQPLIFKLATLRLNFGPKIPLPHISLSTISHIQNVDLTIDLDYIFIGLRIAQHLDIFRAFSNARSCHVRLNCSGNYYDSVCDLGPHFIRELPQILFPKLKAHFGKFQILIFSTEHPFKESCPGLSVGHPGQLTGVAHEDVMHMVAETLTPLFGEGVWGEGIVDGEAAVRLVFHPKKD